MQFTVPVNGLGLIQSVRSPDLCLDVVGGKRGSDSQVAFQSCDGNYEHRHFYVPVLCKNAKPKGPIVWVTNPTRCIAASAEGSSLELQSCAPGDESQDFRLPACQIGKIELGPAGRCLRVMPDAQGNENHNDGALVELWDCDDEAVETQMVWTMPFEASGGSVKLTTVMWAAAAGPVRWTAHPWLCLDVKDGSDADGTPLQVWGCPLDDEEMTPNKNFIVPS